uniref:Uncharacterized protein n=1 Tax=Brassica oleracea TaxID=3712 RepID=A0A3P6D3X3_BRAOL|nr:unnamed protein product [Brassica oleracea]
MKMKTMMMKTMTIGKVWKVRSLTRHSVLQRLLLRLLLRIGFRRKCRTSCSFSFMDCIRLLQKELVLLHNLQLSK